MNSSFSPMRRFPLTIVALLALAPALHAAATRPNEPVATPAPATSEVTAASLIRVNSTNQSYDFFRPWSKKAPSFRKGLGVVVEKNRILVTAELVTNSTYIELEDPVTNARVAGQVITVDYDSNLALLAPSDENFLKNARPLALDKGAVVGDHIELLQLETNGLVAQTPGTITTIAVAPYPLGQLALLTFRISSPIQSRDSSFTIPAVRDGDLVGLLMRYDSRSQTADIIPAPIIAHFLADAAQATYQGFPRVGLGYSPTRDPQLRRYVGLKDDGGVYVTAVRPGGAADKAGIKRGDIILAVAGKPINQDGEFDHPLYGKLTFSHLTSSDAKVGDKVDFVILRDGQKQTIPVTLEAVDRSSIVSDPYIFDKQPRYLVVGGLVFQELSRPYLQEWGANWPKEAPQRLVALDAFQDEDNTPNRGKVVFLSQVFPTASALGYQDLEHLVVSKVNDVPIKSLDDLAKAIANPKNGFHKIEFDDDPPIIYLDAVESEKSDAQIRQEYGIPELKNLN